MVKFKMNIDLLISKIIQYINFAMYGGFYQLISMIDC